MSEIQPDKVNLDRIRLDAMTAFNNLVRALNKNMRNGIIAVHANEIDVYVNQLQFALGTLALIYDDEQEHVNALEDEADRILSLIVR